MEYFRQGLSLFQLRLTPQVCQSLESHRLPLEWRLEPPVNRSTHVPGVTTGTDVFVPLSNKSLHFLTVLLSKHKMI